MSILLKTLSVTVSVAICLFVSAAALGQDNVPRSLDPRVKIELFAEQPQIVTPTGIDVDHLGRVWVIESNTHFRPDSYTGHDSDRLLVMSDADGDGRADKIVVFTDGLTHAMSVVVIPPWLASSIPVADGRRPVLSIYVATRKEIFLLHDDDGDLSADRKQSIVKLDTPGNYPHNGLGGLALDPVGRLCFGLGENLGEKYKIIGTDGTTISGGGEGGNAYRCELDGSRLQYVATGFWNPHASCFDAFGRWFTVDNDPDARPPCRLIHIIPGGDYGYRFRFGRKGLHPFTCWNGEIPGTLPMVAGTGEAPSGVLAYESDGLPQEYVGTLLATSWGDHRIDRFRLQPSGASFTSLPEPIISGGENFRPVGIACAPDGSLYCSDWVLSDYQIHGRGRVWRISMVNAPQSSMPRRLRARVPSKSSRSCLNRQDRMCDDRRPVHWRNKHKARIDCWVSSGRRRPTARNPRRSECASRRCGRCSGQLPAPSNVRLPGGWRCTVRTTRSPRRPTGWSDCI